MPKDKLGHGSEGGVSLNCSCGNPGCAKRMERGLTPFCKMGAPASSQPPAGYGSFNEAAKNKKPGQRTQSVGGLGTGGPRRFVNK